MQMSNDIGELYYQQCVPWLICALFEKERIRALAAEQNLRQALRREDGRDAALIAIGQVPNLVRLQLPRLWALRQSVVAESQMSRQR